MKTRTKALLLAAALGWPGCVMPLTAEELPGAASPQEVMEKSRAGWDAGDLGMAYNLAEPGFRRELALAKLTVADRQITWDERSAQASAEIAARDDGSFTEEQRLEAARNSRELTARLTESRRRFAELLEKTGVAPHVAPGTRFYDLTEDALAALLEKVDQGKLIAELKAYYLALHPESALPVPSREQVEVTEYRITGDRATAKVGDHVVEFVRVAGRWYFAPPPIPKVVEPKCGVAPQPTPTERHHAGARGCG
jgi:hypothetical protein